MVAGSLARRYARAVMQLGATGGPEQMDKMAADIRVLAKAMKDSEELQTVLTNPAIRRNDRRKVLDGLLQHIGAQPLSKNLVYLLLDSERLGSLGAISREVDAMIQAKSGHVSAEITSARPLDAAQLGEIKVALEKLSGKQVDITRREDPELLGGVTAKVGDVIYDGSLRTQLRALRDELTK